MRVKDATPSLMLLVMLSLPTPLVHAADTGIYIAGTSPSIRPEGMPTITQVQHNTPWYVAALHGVEPPYPPSLNFLDNQGDWFTPFTHAGMSAPYDIRQWHAQP
jgi:hypothetical protein